MVLTRKDKTYLTGSVDTYGKEEGLVDFYKRRREDLKIDLERFYWYALGYLENAFIFYYRSEHHYKSPTREDLVEAWAILKPGVEAIVDRITDGLQK